MAQTNRKIIEFLHNELNAQRLSRWNNHYDMNGNTVQLECKSLRYAEELGGILNGMGCVILRKEMYPAGVTSIIIALPSREMPRQTSRECEACDGIGAVNGETCWHCEGEGIDPTL